MQGILQRDAYKFGLRSSGNVTDAPPPDDHLRQFECSLDRVISNIDKTSGVFLIKVRKSGVFSDNFLVPALNAAA